MREKECVCVRGGLQRALNGEQRTGSFVSSSLTFLYKRQAQGPHIAHKSIFGVYAFTNYFPSLAHVLSLPHIYTYIYIFYIDLL